MADDEMSLIEQIVDDLFGLGLRVKLFAQTVLCKTLGRHPHFFF